MGEQAHATGTAAAFTHSHTRTHSAESSANFTSLSGALVQIARESCFHSAARQLKISVCFV